MDNERRVIIRKVYLSAIADTAFRIDRLARLIERARHYNELPEVEREDFSRSELTLEQAGLVASWPSLEQLREAEKALDDVASTLGASFDW